MAWKNLSYWFKWGIVSLIIYTIIFVVAIPLLFDISGNSPLKIIAYSLYPWMEFIHKMNTNEITTIILLYVMDAFTYFGIGSLIGLFISKIKKKD